MGLCNFKGICSLKRINIRDSKFFKFTFLVELGIRRNENIICEPKTDIKGVVVRIELDVRFVSIESVLVHIFLQFSVVQRRKEKFGK